LFDLLIIHWSGKKSQNVLSQETRGILVFLVILIILDKKDNQGRMKLIPQ